jgi:cell division protein ZapA
VTEERTVTTVEIAGEEYAIRSEASSEYTLECARYVDRTIAEIMTRGSLIEAHKAAILAALALADQLFQARREASNLRDELAGRSARLQAEIEARLAAGRLASEDP